MRRGDERELESWLRWAVSPAAAMLVLLLFYVVLLASLRDKSPATDEPGHATAGYSYWLRNDYRIDPENGNLTKRWISLPLVLGGYSFPPVDSTAWKDADSWRLADEWFYRMGHGDDLVFWGRAAAGVFAVLLGGLVWGWSRRLFGDTGGMISLLMFVLNPTVLANGALMTSDMAAAFFLLLSTACWWRMLGRMSVGNVLLSAVVGGALFLAKMSAFVVVPVAVTLALIRLAQGLPLAVGGSRLLVRRSHQALALAAAFAAHALIVVLMIWASFGFRYSAFWGGDGASVRFNLPWQFLEKRADPISLLERLSLGPAQDQQAAQVLLAHDALARDWSNRTLDAFEELKRSVLTRDQVLHLEASLDAPTPGFFPRMIRAARRARLLPEAYLYGVAHVWRFSGYRAAFLNGEISVNGWWSFFPFTFLVKTPLVWIALVLLAVGVWFRSPLTTRAELQGERGVEWAPLAVFFSFYGIIAIVSQTNIGHRHILPIYAPLSVGCGALTWWLGESMRRPGSRLRWYLAGGLVAALTVEVTSHFPNYVAYFNGVVAPRSAYRHLLDSSLDWGQELPAVRRYIDAHAAGAPFYLAFFGSGSPRHYGVRAKSIFGYPGIEHSMWGAIKILPGAVGRADDPAVAAALRAEPDYDQRLIGEVALGDRKGAVLFKHGDALRLGAGTYLISASLSQPIFFRNAELHWSEAHERTYRTLVDEIAPFLSADPAVWARAFGTKTAGAWQKVFERFDEYRFARLSAFLRHRRPDDLIRNSILVFKLSDAEIAQALEGPPPFPR